MSNSTALSIDTPPSLTQCENTTIVWNGGVQPFYIGYIASGTIQATATATPSPAVAFRTTENSQEWLCNVAAGVGITFSVRDSAGTIAYSSPIEVQNSTDITCLPGYTPPSPSPSSSRSSASSAPPSSSISSTSGAANSSTGLSDGAIGGIAAGAVIAALVIALVIFFVWRFGKRRRESTLIGSDTTEKAGDGDEGGEPKIEPYVGRGDVDLAEQVDYRTETGHATSPGAMGTTTTATSGSGQVGELERQTKQMLGVQSSASPPTTSTDQSRSIVSPIPIKGASQSGPSRASPTHPSPTGHTTSSSPTLAQSQAERPMASGEDQLRSDQEAEIEYVRHTDGGGMRVELPPLYSEVPRREGDGL